MGGAEHTVPGVTLMRRRGKEAWNHKKDLKVDLHQKSVNLETQHLDSSMTLWTGT